jgi:KipI family sensor histidine kinase inhibitor
VTIRPASDCALLISYGEEISELTHREVLRAYRALAGVREIVNLHPAYASLLLEFDPRRRSHTAMEALARERLATAGEEPLPEPRQIEIPVRYGGESGPDLADVARHAGLTPERVVQLHASAVYVVYFLGFSPGFAYLGGMPPEIAAPRLPSPRKRVPAGSVAIGGNQTGVYPLATPGGWRIIGRTPLRLFRPEAEAPVLLQMGDRVRFVAMEERP